jgi:TM2 domain-containing membrane protein YozV
MEMIGVLMIVLYYGIVLAVLFLVINLLWRFVRAIEQIARHLLEIARDIKMLAQHKMDEKNLSK